MKTFWLLMAAVSLVATTSCGGGSSSETPIDSGVHQLSPLVDNNLQLIYTPSTAGHQPFIDAINSAETSVRMVMYLLTDPNVIQALINAHNRNVNVQVILDQASLSQASHAVGYQQLLAAGVDVMKSSAGFSITHEKAMAIDDHEVFVTAMNMSTGYSTERDFGVITQNTSVLAEWNKVFSADVTNASAGTAVTPPLSVPSLLWSPVTSETQLVALISSATSSIITTVENLTDSSIISALSAAAKRRVKVRIITPQCVLAQNPLLNYPALKELAAAGVSARVMPYPATATTPYMHSKMILADDTVAYVGSVNFTINSTQHAREAGILFENTAAAQTISSIFETDWSNSVEVPTTPPTFCPVSN